MESKQDKLIVIIDYQLGNLFSVNQALANIGLKAIISSDPEDVDKADAIVLPGVGAFADAMKNLEAMKLADAIKQHVAAGKPFLGICLGLQLLFSESEEFGSTVGLGLIRGAVRRFKTGVLNNKTIKIPQIAWNQITKAPGASWENTPLMNMENNEYMYFVHSFYVEPAEDVALTYTTYGNTTYVSSIIKENIFACQFHPEKSAEKGLLIYRDWAVLNGLI